MKWTWDLNWQEKQHVGRLEHDPSRKKKQINKQKRRIRIRKKKLTTLPEGCLHIERRLNWVRWSISIPGSFPGWTIKRQQLKQVGRQSIEPSTLSHANLVFLFFFFFFPFFFSILAHNFTDWTMNPQYSNRRPFQQNKIIGKLKTLRIQDRKRGYCAFGEVCPWYSCWKEKTRTSRLVASALGARRTATDRPCAFRLCFYYRATQRVSLSLSPVTTTKFSTFFVKKKIYLSHFRIEIQDDTFHNSNLFYF